jgi:hypothetical protein
VTLLTQNSSGHDLLDSNTFEDVLSDISHDEYQAGLASPPCSSFSAARSSFDGGPPPLRSEDCPYGLPDLSQADRDKVKVGTLLALRAL